MPENRLRFEPITESEVNDVLVNLKSSRTDTCDQLDTIVLKNCAAAFVKPLTCLFNETFDKGQIPGLWKKAIITPILKKGCNNLVINYRPISIISHVVKILEKIIFKRIFNFIKSNKLLNMSQSGFVPGDSTTNQLVSMYYAIQRNLDRGNATKLVFFDIHKLFDKIWHKGLLHKLKGMGFDSIYVNWFSDYLTNRSICVKVNGALSSYKSISAGVPQGSVMGPLFFLIYINNINTGLKNPVHLYADDTCLSINFNQTNLESKTISLNNDLEQINKWAKMWHVTFSAEKTKSLLIKHHASKTSDISATFQDVTIHPSCSVKHLGVIMDDNGKWKSQCINSSGRGRQRNSMLRKSRKYLSRYAAKICVNAFVRPVLEYAAPVWDNASLSLKQRLDDVYISSLRMQCGLPYYASKEAVWTESQAECLQQRRNKQSLMIFHLIVYRYCPEHLLSVLDSLTLSVSLREQTFGSITGRTAGMNTSVINTMVNLWNKLPDEVRKCADRLTFKRKLN